VGFDHVLEAVGSATTVRSAFDAARRGGAVTVIGAGSAEVQVPVSLYELLTEKKLQGSYYGGRDVFRVFEQVITLWRDHRLDLDSMITHRVELEDINEALALMRSGQALRTTVAMN
jgi:S-(hydroxymethyl)glutathione dehydrogenase/alcohol dehydrogenase